MAKESIDTIVRTDSIGPLEGHGIGNRDAEMPVKKGEFTQVGESVDLSSSPYSPNRKTGSSSGVDY